MSEISAAGAVPAPADAVFDHLADLRNHWRLAAGRVRLVDPDGEAAARGGRVELRGPLGIRRLASTEVVRTERARLLEGRAWLGDRTEARIRWSLTPNGEAVTRVELGAELVRTGRLDRLLLAVGARRWLRRLFAEVLERLAELAPDLRADAPPPAASQPVAAAGRR